MLPMQKRCWLAFSLLPVLYDNIVAKQTYANVSIVMKAILRSLPSPLVHVRMDMTAFDPVGQCRLKAKC